MGSRGNGVINFNAPDQPGWVRAIALTSAIYLAR